MRLSDLVPSGTSKARLFYCLVGLQDSGRAAPPGGLMVFQARLDPDCPDAQPSRQGLAVVATGLESHQQPLTPGDQSATRPQADDAHLPAYRCRRLDPPVGSPP